MGDIVDDNKVNDNGHLHYKLSRHYQYHLKNWTNHGQLMRRTLVRKEIAFKYMYDVASYM